MPKLYLNRSFSYTRCDPLPRTMPHIAYREDPRHAGFEQARIAVESPAFRTFPLANQVDAGQNESAVVAVHHALQPVGAGFCADEDEERTRLDAVNCARRVAPDRNLFEPRAAEHLLYAGPGLHFNIGCLFDAIDQVPGHGCREG